LLRFGDGIELNAEEYKNIQNIALDKMNDKLDLNEINLIIESNTKKSVKDFFTTVITSLSIDYANKNKNIEITVEIIPE